MDLGRAFQGFALNFASQPVAHFDRCPVRFGPHHLEIHECREHKLFASDLRQGQDPGLRQAWCLVHAKRAAMARLLRVIDQLGSRQARVGQRQ